MHLGKPAGAAMPLAWAHAEYIKLLRSVNDRQIFDRIPLVAHRYGRQQGRKDLEVWKLNRRVRAIAAGSTLRVVLPGTFRLRWSADQGENLQEVASTSSRLGLGFVDLPTPAGQSGALRFTLLGTEDARLEDTVHEVVVKPGR